MTTLALATLSNQELLARLPGAVRAESTATAEVIAYLAELDRRRLYLDEACSSLYSYCIERLGYSEEAAIKRVRVSRLAQRFPRVLEELSAGAIHLTGLYLLSPHLSDDNAEALLAEARGKTRRELEAVLARRFPRPDVLASLQPVAGKGDLVASTDVAVGTLPGKGDFAGSAEAAASATPRSRIEPLSSSSSRVELTAGPSLCDKIELARNLSSHAVPSGDLAALVERAFDALIEAETRRRLGAGKPRQPRALKPGSRHVPVEVARAVWERDGSQCTFVDAQGRRCSEKRFLTLEHRQPFACGGPATVDNLSLLCAPHNAHSARKVFGEEHVAGKRAEAESFDKTLAALVSLGFERKAARVALETSRARGSHVEMEPALRAALAFLVS